MIQAPEPQAEKKSSFLSKYDRKKMLGMALVIGLLFVMSVIFCLYEYRNTQTTDDAYVMGNEITISSQLFGNVISVHFLDTDLVHKGDILVSLDDTDAKINYNRAVHNLENTVRKINQLYINNERYASIIRQKEVAYKQASDDFIRRKKLSGAAAISREELQHANNAVAMSKAELDVARDTYLSNKVMINGKTLENQPEVLEAQEKMRQAWVALQRTKVRSPVNGYIARRNVQIGENVSKGQALMSVVPHDEVWVDANFKETQLRRIKIGQNVSVITDFYGREVVFNGKVEGISLGTGSAFSVLPAQNATGNWIKVVQRLAVRVSLDPLQIKSFPLRIGLSASIKLQETGGSGGAFATVQRNSPAFYSDALVINTKIIDKEINKIVKANSN
ncbi:HlyD family efflux transporter periplasmic adaptor subunit (plasmid) [Enterobacter asburiae]|uniref:HlyD family secretion protein n=1 Tax=Enterobacter asburiae TaxID=61645 RepID=UPI00293226A6|nr:HlyD family efflux transporter periplasmic adaptor subunit [Enterobacter asburiae]EMA4739796.1 HlyD family efflux transporter periplasmic adaptor subunit [Enterobacter asburiae]